MDIALKERLMDVFLRNTISCDWEILELKDIQKTIKFNSGLAGFTAGIYSAIEQVRNYGRLLNQDSVKRKLSEMGIEYFFPELKNVLKRTPEIDVLQWRTLKSHHEKDLKILTLEEMYKAQLRYDNRMRLFNP